MTDDLEARAPCLKALTESQLQSLAELPKPKKFGKYEDITLENRSIYHRISCRPITKAAEDDMELVSDIVTWGELYLFHSEIGSYCCSQCDRPLYHSSDKWRGPCVWPSFRKPLALFGPRDVPSEGSEEKNSIVEAISSTKVTPYNKYTVTVKEVYCGGCNLFIGHQFEDGRAKGDAHPEARWRH